MRVLPVSFLIVCAGSIGFFPVSAAEMDSVPVKTKDAKALPKSQTFGAELRQKTLKGDLTLEEAVTLALRQNPDVLRAVREIERVHGQIVEVRAQALPHLGVVGSFTNTDPRLTGVGVAGTVTQNNAWSIALEAKQTIYAGGQVRAAIEVAKLTQGASYFSLRDVLDRTVSDVRKQFAQILVTTALIDVAQESVELASKQLEDTQNRFTAGVVPRFNVLRAEVELASVKPVLIRAKNDALLARLQLAKTLGLDASPDGKPTFECIGELRVEKQPIGLSDALSLGRARRPSLKSQREQILIEKERIKIAYAGFHPKVDANADYQIRSKGTRNVEDSISGYFLGVTGRWNIFDSFETMGVVAQAKARFESALITYEDAVQQVELEVQRAFADLQQFRETIESQQKNVQQALEALRLSQERLAAGAGTQLEILDARVALTRARNTELQAQGDYVRALAEFERATAMTTVYAESFKDPLSVLPKRVLRQAPSELFTPVVPFKK